MQMHLAMGMPGPDPADPSGPAGLAHYLLAPGGTASGSSQATMQQMLPGPHPVQQQQQQQQQAGTLSSGGVTLGMHMMPLPTTAQMTTTHEHMVLFPLASQLTRLFAV